MKQNKSQMKLLKTAQSEAKSKVSYFNWLEAVAEAASDKTKEASPRLQSEMDVQQP